MAQQTNPLLSPPFFLIEGINPSAPLSVQMEQIDQLNTLLLQEIDENFAKFHQTVTSKILPEIKRFAIAGEPTREAAQVRSKVHASPVDSAPRFGLHRPVADCRLVLAIVLRGGSGGPWYGRRRDHTGRASAGTVDIRGRDRHAQQRWERVVFVSAPRWLVCIWQWCHGIDSFATEAARE